MTTLQIEVDEMRVDAFVAALNSTHWYNVADQISAQRRISEPTLWGVVRARVDTAIHPNSYKWVRDEIGWACLGQPLRVSGFEHLINPGLIRPGVGE